MNPNQTDLDPYCFQYWIPKNLMRGADDKGCDWQAKG